jgi:CRISPR-associated protein Cmr1
MAWTTLTLQVTTPLFNGGADPDGTLFQNGQEAGVRAASIRGAMRFWFRALAGCFTGPDLRLLSSLERRVFGGGAGQDNDGPAPSPVLLRIPRQPATVSPGGRHSFLPDPHRPLHERRQDDSRWIVYLMGQGLGDLSQVAVKRPYVAPGEEFQVRIGFRHSPRDSAEPRTAIEVLALASLWLTCTYGGVGARTRRGFGGVRITGAEGEPPAVWQEPGALLTPGLDHYRQLEFLAPSGVLAPCGDHIAALAPSADFQSADPWGGTTPAFPVLGQAHTKAATSGGEEFMDWVGTLVHAGEQFRYFRANRPHPGARYRPRIETQEWVETIRGPGNDFPLGALGLPVGFKDGYTVNVNRDRGEPLRRASPLWLRAVGSGSRWRLLSYAFHMQFLPGPDAPGVYLWHGRQGKQLHVADGDVTRQTSQWINVLRDDESFGDHVRS